MKFKKGDKVKIINDCTHCLSGETAVLNFGTKDNNCKKTLFAWGKGKDANCSCENNWIKISNYDRLL